MVLVLSIAPEEKLWEKAESVIKNCKDNEHMATFISSFVASAEVATNSEWQMPFKRSKREIAESEMKAYATILTTSAITVAMITFICLIIMLHIFIYMRWGITRQLILLNAKVCALESRLGTRQLSEDLQKKLCEEIGATYTTIQNERQKFAQEVVNGEVFVN
uniref:Uncharacterized protein n=1 Tax=Setaria digitata TaxID=48799 RepID=A0A915Q7P3_9BILA